VSTVMELTMHAKPGHFERLQDVYANVVNTIENNIDDTRMIMIVADPATEMLRGIGLYEHADVVESFPDVPFFVEFAEAAAPHLSGPSERVELQVEHIFVGDGLVVDGGQPAVAEITLHARFGQIEEVLAAYTKFFEYLQANLAGTWLLLMGADRGSGVVRGFGLYADQAIADSVMSLAASAEFAKSVEPFLISPLERVEHRLLHLFLSDGS